MAFPFSSSSSTHFSFLQKIIKALPHQKTDEPDLAPKAPQRPPSPSTPLLVSAPPPHHAPSERQSGGENAVESPHPDTAPLLLPPLVETPLAAIVTNPVEQNFFRLLHQEVRKVSYFYHKLLHELCLRYERIQDTVQQLLLCNHATEEDRADNTYSVYRLLQQQPEHAAASRRNRDRGTAVSITTSDRRPHHYFRCNQSIYKLYRDLLFLELYSIMALTSFSKILKKHDKVTGYCTKYAFMTKVVLPANFVAAPTQPMMEQCLEWYDGITHRWQQEEEQDVSRLFLDMIRRLRSHVPAPQTE
jgi:SPX domain